MITGKSDSGTETLLICERNEIQMAPVYAIFLSYEHARLLQKERYKTGYGLYSKIIQQGGPCMF